MGFVDGWTDTYTASSVTSRAFTVPSGKTIPVGSLLVFALGAGAGAASATCVDSKGNTWATDEHAAHTGSTLNGTLFTCRVTTQLVPGDTITPTLGTASNRFACIFGWFNDIVMPPNKVLSTPVSASVDPAPTGTTLSLLVSRALVLCAVATTAAGLPATAQSGATLVASVPTAAGSSDRGIALSYEYEGSGTHSGSFDLASAATSVTMVSAYEANPVGSGLGFSYWNGSVEVPITAISYWNGSVEVPIVSAEKT